MEAFIQYKNTDICLDFHCSCGEHNHYDGYFAYEIACGECGKKFELSDKIQVTELSPEESKGLGALEPIKFNENREVIEEVEDFSNVKTYPNYKTNVVLFDHNEIANPYIAGEGKPEIIEPIKPPANSSLIIKELWDEFLSNSPGPFREYPTPQAFIDRCIEKLSGNTEYFKAIIPEVYKPTFENKKDYKGVELEFSSRLTGDQYYFTAKN